MSRTRPGLESGTATRAALRRFTAFTVAVMLGVGSGTALVSRRIADDEAVRDARARTTAIAHSIAAPLVNADVRRRDPEALRRLGHALLHRMRDGSVAHVVLYDLDGLILWSDDPALVGTRDRLRPEVLAGTADQGSVVTRTEDHPRTSSPEAQDGSLVEVYVGARDADGHPFVFEAYTPRQQLRSDARTIFGDLLPLTLGSLLLLLALILPLAISLARRIDRANAQRATLLRRSLEAWHRERAHIAQTLHDDVIQDLSACSYALPGVLQVLPTTPAGQAARQTGQRLNEVVVESLRTLRVMLSDLVPAGLDGASLRDALAALARRSRDAGLQVRLDVDEALAPSATVGGLIYRSVREGLRNVHHHAGADEASVDVHQRGSVIEIVIDDDGHGPAPQTSRSDEHVGLRLLEHLLGDVGGSARLTERPGGGARLRVTIPARLPDLEGVTPG